MAQTVGVIGLGLMGSAVCPHLIEAGFEVIGCDIEPDKVDAMAAIGVRPVESARTVAEQADVAILLLPSAAALRDVVEGPDGIAAAETTDVIVVDSSTLLLADKERARDALAGCGIAMLDCPVSGTRSQVVEKDVVVFASGADDAVASCLPVFAAYSRATKRLGAFGNATRMKLVHNLLTQVHLVAAAEAFTLGMKSGLDPDTILDVISDSAASSRMFQIRGPRMAAQDYDDAAAQDRGAGQGRPRDRRVRRRSALPAARVRGQHAGGRGRHGGRPRQAGHGVGLRGAGKVGGVRTARARIVEMTRRRTALGGNRI